MTMLINILVLLFVLAVGFTGLYPDFFDRR